MTGCQLIIESMSLAQAECAWNAARPLGSAAEHQRRVQGDVYVLDLLASAATFSTTAVLLPMA
jgi:hypothetical protein